MMDMSATITPRSDQINADDLITGPMTVTVARVNIKGPNEDQPVDIHLEGDRRVFRPCKLMRRVMVKGWGADASAYVGRSMTLYRDPDVKWGAMAVGGIRISHMSHLGEDFTVTLLETRGKQKLAKIRKLAGAPVRSEPEAQKSEAPVLSEEIRAQALDAASRGSEAFRGFWKSDTAKPHRAAMQSVLEECQRIAKAADDAVPDDEPEPDEAAAQAYIAEGGGDGE